MARHACHTAGQLVVGRKTKKRSRSDVRIVVLYRHHETATSSPPDEHVLTTCLRLAVRGQGQEALSTQRTRWYTRVTRADNGITHLVAQMWKLTSSSPPPPRFSQRGTCTDTVRTDNTSATLLAPCRLACAVGALLAWCRLACLVLRDSCCQLRPR